MLKRIKGESGSVTIEATISLSAFMFAIVTLLTIVNICLVQARVAVAINTTAKELSQYSYLYSLTGFNKSEAELAQAAKDGTQDIDSIMSDINTVFNEIENLGNTGKSSMDNISDISKSWDSAVGSADKIKDAGSSLKSTIEDIAKDPKQLMFGIAKMAASEGLNLAKSRLVAAPLSKVLCKKHLNGAYSKSVKDIVVTETNVNKLNNIKITLFKNSDTIKLKNGTDYRIDVEGGNGKWYKYVYTIFAKNFSDDGVYRLSFHSEDAAGNISENTLDTKNKEIRFGVDKTKPNVVLDNLESGQTYPLEKLKVSMIANDNLLLNSVVVYLDNYDKAYKTWDAKETADILGKNGEFTFDVSGNSTRAHKMKVVCTDAAGNKITKEIKDFYVTTNLFIRYYNNKLLFFGSIAGFLLIVGVIVYAIVRKKKAK